LYKDLKLVMVFSKNQNPTNPVMGNRSLTAPLFVLKKTGASYRDKTETLRHWRAPLFFPALREKKASRYAGGSLLLKGFIR